MSTFVTSDHHFYHKNILKYQAGTRPFNSVEEMNEGLIERHNEVVKPDDQVYMMGDFGFASPKRLSPILERMNGVLHFIYGNHDGSMQNKFIQRHFRWMKPYHEMNYKDNRFILFHYPIFSWNNMHHGSYQLYGHTHGQIPHLYHGRSMDVGVDTNNCYPYDLDKLIGFFKDVEERSDDDDFHTDPRGREEKR